jgi:hypothetical protein
MSTFEAFYDINPVARIDQNVWDDKILELVLQFHAQPILYTPLIDWDNRQQQTGAQTSRYTELLEGDVDVDEIPFAANYLNVTTGVDSRSRSLASKRYGDKVQLHKSNNIFQQWQLSGSRDWRPLLRGILGRNVIKKHERLARNAFFLQPKDFWTISGGGTDFSDVGASDVFSLNMVNEWNLRLGNIGNPIVPGDIASAKLALVPPGATYDFMQTLPSASANETALWLAPSQNAGQRLKYEIGTYKNIRFQEVPNDKYGENAAVLYNSGVISYQCGVSAAMLMGDGSPDPEDATVKVDDVWEVGQKDVTHYIQLESGADMSKFTKNEIVTIHTQRTSYFGITDGVEFRSGKTVNRRVVSIDTANYRLCFDRPVMFNYDKPFVATPNSTAVQTLYAFVTVGRHVGFVLVMGSRGGIMGEIAKPIEFYEPKPIDDFESVWRFVWDEYLGYNIWEPYLFECHFCAVTLPKIGGVITP